MIWRVVVVGPPGELLTSAVRPRLSLVCWVGPLAAGNDKRRLRPVANLDGCPRRRLGESALPRSGFVFAAPQVCKHSSGGGVLPGDLFSRASGKPTCDFFGYLFLRCSVVLLRALCGFMRLFLFSLCLRRSPPFRRSGKSAAPPSSCPHGIAPSFLRSSFGCARLRCCMRESHPSFGSFSFCVFLLGFPS